MDRLTGKGNGPGCAFRRAIAIQIACRDGYPILDCDRLGLDAEVCAFEKRVAGKDYGIVAKQLVLNEVAYQRNAADERAADNRE